MPLREDERLPVLEHRVPDPHIIRSSSDKTGHKSEKVKYKCSIYGIIFINI